MNYDPKSSHAEEFIHHGEIEETLAYGEANRTNRELIDEILAKARERRGLTHREAMVLLDCGLEDKNQEIYELAEQIKKDFYGNRIVLFAPLYLSNYCINGCVYCPYHAKNKHIPRKKLTQDEIRREVMALQDMGHKRLALETGEDPVHNPIEYMLESIDTIYSIKHKNGAIRRVNVNIRTRESVPIFCSRRHITRKAMRSFIPQGRSMITVTTQRQWTVHSWAVLMMWDAACCLAWSFTGMNLRDF